MAVRHKTHCITLKMACPHLELHYFEKILSETPDLNLRSRSPLVWRPPLLQPLLYPAIPRPLPHLPGGGGGEGVTTPVIRPHCGGRCAARGLLLTFISLLRETRAAPPVESYPEFTAVQTGGQLSYKSARHQ